MYVLPRGLEAAWSSARKRAWVPIVPFGETILGMAAMGMVMNAYKVRCCFSFTSQLGNVMADDLDSTSQKQCQDSCAVSFSKYVVRHEECSKRHRPVVIPCNRTQD